MVIFLTQFLQFCLNTTFLGTIFKLCYANVTVYLHPLDSLAYGGQAVHESLALTLVILTPWGQAVQAGLSWPHYFSETDIFISNIHEIMFISLKTYHSKIIFGTIITSW